MGPHSPVFTRAMAKHLEELRTIARHHFEAPGFVQWGHSEREVQNTLGMHARTHTTHRLLPSRRAAKLVHEKLAGLGCTRNNTLFAASVCSDELNHEHGDICTSLEGHWGECFGLGGLAGVPFTGLAGFRAFRDHVPHDGNMFVLFAPHVGVSPDGLIGRYARRGQLVSDRLSNTCGAAVGALAAARAAAATHHHHPECTDKMPAASLFSSSDPFTDPLLDFQINWLKQSVAAQLSLRDPASGPLPRMAKLVEHLEEWKSAQSGSTPSDASRADSEQAVLARAMYDIIATAVDSIVTAGMSTTVGAAPPPSSSIPSNSTTAAGPAPSPTSTPSAPSAATASIATTAAAGVGVGDAGSSGGVGVGTAGAAAGRQVVYLLGGIQVNVSDVHLATDDPHQPPDHIHSDLFLPMMFEAREWYQGRPGVTTSLMSVFDSVSVD